MTEILLSGCSYTKGFGLDLEKNDSNNAYNVFVREYFKNNYNITNVAESGNSNLSIYFSSSTALIEKHYDYAFVGWTSYPRYNFRLGFETYAFGNRVVFTGMPLDDTVEHNGHVLSYNKKWLTEFKDRYFLAHHDHFEVVNLMKYITLLIDLADRVGTKLYFVNNICSWDDTFFDRFTSFLPSELSEKTQKLLDTETRDDAEIFELYNLMHNDFEANGGIRENRWINLYTPFKKLDIGNDNWHPGPLSHKTFGIYLAQRFFELDQITNIK
jgi:hypothetical protein